MNSDIMSVPQTKTARELNQGGTSTTETVFTTDGTIPVVLPLPTVGQLCGASMAQRASIYFRVIAVGRVVTSGTLNFTVALYLQTALALTAGNKIATSGTVSLASKTTNWILEALLIWDSDSKIINGKFAGQVDTTVVAATTISNVQTAQNPTTGVVQGFVVSATFGTGAAGNKAFLDWFVLVPMH